MLSTRIKTYSVTIPLTRYRPCWWTIGGQHSFAVAPAPEFAREQQSWRTPPGVEPGSRTTWWSWGRWVRRWAAGWWWCRCTLAWSRLQPCGELRPWLQLRSTDPHHWSKTKKHLKFIVLQFSFLFLKTYIKWNLNTNFKNAVINYVKY